MTVLNGELPKILLVSGVREGVGATSISLALAVRLRVLTGKEVLLIDTDQANGADIDVMLNAGPLKELAHVCEELSIFNEAMVRSYLEVKDLMIGAVRAHFMREDDVDRSMRLAGMYDWVVIDAGVKMRRPFKEVAAKGACRIVVGDGSSTGAARLKARVNEERDMYGDADKLVVVHNRSPGVDAPVAGSGKRSCAVRHECGFPYGILGQRSGNSAADKGAAICDIDALVEAVKGLDHGALSLSAFTPSAGDICRLKDEVLLELQRSLGAKWDGVGSALPSMEVEAELRRLVLKASSGCMEAGEREAIVGELVEEMLGGGPLGALLCDPSITDVMINGHERVFVERGGKITVSDISFRNEGQLKRLIERSLAPLGRRVDESSPMVDARLADGSRLNVILPPLSLNGPVVTVRKFRSSILSAADLVSRGAMSEEMAEFFRRSVQERLNILVSGGTGSGKTTLLNVFSTFIPEDERIITIEDSAELKLAQAHVVSLESRPPNIEGRGEVTIRDLVRNSLRMRPDRIIVGECRGGEALDMLQAMNTGHEGSMTTIHANSARDALSRLETLVMFSGVDLPSRVVREQIVSAIDLIVQLVREKDGQRRVASVVEVMGMEGDRITTQDIFRGSAGGFTATGFVPKGLDTKG